MASVGPAVAGDDRDHLGVGPAWRCHGARRRRRLQLRWRCKHVKDVQDLIGGISDADDISIDRKQDRSGRRRRELHSKFLGQWLTVFVNFTGQYSTPDKLFLPAFR